ncbi:hypothetical protein CH333_05360 [candidate division WOR-3 bacterium JGI_Cruoil_03_44_89]|uniref:Uncharacterized protein n=1 Tax=candidate division WOR-3 bacterium JGI_Cruoil_03_44_89 TaxID=1973748 RepID=A0A235BT05_UNCW3|nr:MAG: hypothetical protein CH333_05360 [candidate division WOR-3 bacterium JGI_Cruoil_03_44_89]
MNKTDVPLIKEYRINRQKKCLKCIYKYAFDRDKQKECILSLYHNRKERSSEHREKSIFRGMVIPSLRYLGLIVGYGDSIRISANGKLIIESEAMNSKLHERVLRAVIYEVDKNIFHFIDFIKGLSSFPPREIINKLCNKISGPPDKQKRERIRKFLSILEQVKLMNHSSQKLSLNKKKYNQAIKDVDVSMKNIEDFKKCFFDAYFEVSKNTAGIADIVDIREKVSIQMLKEYKVIVTEDQFDELLRGTPFETEKYIISLGEPMGAEEKLFKYKGDYFRTLYIKTRKMGVTK